MKKPTEVTLKFWIGLIGFCAIILFIPYSDYLISKFSKVASFDSETFLYLIAAFSFSLAIFKIIIGIKRMLK